MGDAGMAFLFGIDERAAAEGRPLATYVERVHPDDRLAIQEKVAEVLSEGGPLCPGIPRLQRRWQTAVGCGSSPSKNGR